ncbi:MAG: hypothetical protein M1837_003975 [Sclerophora amabilis]|nr:MAG: hypothetical protein M1837_003975 [Sclerophora amabilis]
MTNGAQSAGRPAANAALSASASTGSADFPHDLDDDDMIKEETDGEEASEVDGVTKSFGFMKMDATKSMYVSEGHWVSILSNIAEVKNYFADHKQQFEDQLEKVNASKGPTEYGGSGFLFGASDPPERSEIMSSLPGRPCIDKLVSRYFNSYDPVSYIIHGPTFQKEYENHWQNPSETGLVWLGGLFAIMCLAMQSYLRAGDEPPEFKGKVKDMAETYRKRTMDCLASADICKPVPGMIETLILYLQGEFSRSRDTELGVWVVIGVIVRLAMRMGYHRDSKPFPTISPFQGEMRRRVWTFVRQMDILISFQIGLPSMVRAEDCDTASPRNIYDDEFWDGISELPPSRPSTEPTPISYMITKSGLAYVFGKIVEQTSSLVSTPYERVMELNDELMRARTSMPPHLQMRSIEQSISDPANLIMQRFNLDLLYLKSQCVLHRKYLCYARSNPKFIPSSRACVDAATGLLEHQATLHRESRPNGRLRSLKWFVSSLTTHDFLLAAMIVSLNLYQQHRKHPSTQSMSDPCGWDAQHGTRMKRALETSNSIWKELKDESMEAFKASTMLDVLSEKLESPRPASPSKQQQFGTSSLLPGDSSFVSSSFEQEKPEHSAAMTLGMLSSGGMGSTPSSGFDRTMTTTPGGNIQMTEASGLTPNFALDSPSGMGVGNGGNNTGASLSSIFGGGAGTMDIPTSLDWDAWDSYVQGTSFDPLSQAWPASMDLPPPTPGGGPLDPSRQPLSQQPPPPPQQQQQQPPMYPINDSVFMGVNTPSNNSTM